MNPKEMYIREEYEMSPVEYTICECHGNLFEFVASTYTYETFIQFVPLFLRSEFCRREWDTSYSRYQYHDPEENMDFIIPELSKLMNFDAAKDDDEIYSPSIAHWMGFVYRQIYILTKTDSREIIEKLPMSKLESWYPGLHTIDEEQAASIILENVNISDP